jgi:transposase InsO family protein
MFFMLAAGLYTQRVKPDHLGQHPSVRGVCSMSRKGNCWDNAVAERFFLNLKMERVGQREYANHAEAKIDIAA